MIICSILMVGANELKAWKWEANSTLGSPPVVFLHSRHVGIVVKPLDSSTRRGEI